MDSEAEEIGRKLAIEDGLKPTQLRRYYDDIQNLRARLDRLTQELSKSLGEEKKARSLAFERLRSDFKMLKAKAAYAHGRKLIPERLLAFFINHVHSVSSAEDFEVFFKHFQAVLAFHKFYKPSDSD
jgi:CRISPR-associated protein Csm2